jgi:copper transport protein
MAGDEKNASPAGFPMRKMIRRACLWLFLALILSAGLVRPAAAHAVLIASDPADHAILAQSPTRLRLTFDETIALTELELVGPNGTAIPLQAQAVDADIGASLTHPLARGIYTLSYRVISADGHVVGGAIQFGVGLSQGNWNTPSSDIPALRWGLAACDWIAMLGGFLAFGLPLPGHPASKARRRCGDLAALLAALATWAALGFQGLAVTGAPADGLAQANIWLAGAATPAAQFAGMITLGLFLQRVSLRASQRFRTVALALGAALVILAFATTGHVYAIGSAASAVLAIHVVCAVFWVSALLPLLARLREAEPAAALQRFSQLALPAVAVLIAAGAVIAYLQVQHFDQIWTTPYGIVLGVKIACVAMALAFASVNRWVLTPAIDRGDTRALGRAFLSIRIEIVLLAAILALTAALGQLTPPRHLLAAEQAMAPRVLLKNQMAMDRGAMALATMSASASGSADLSVRFTDSASKPVAVQNAMAEFTNLDTGAGPLRQALTLDADGYRANGILLMPQGHWRLTIKADFSDFDRRIFMLDLSN